MDALSTIIAVVSLVVSLATAWLTMLRRGTLRMTAPSIVFLGYDEAPMMTPKVFIRAMLYATADRGQVVEAMYAKLTHGGDEQLFSFWGYGERSELVAGGGLFIGRAGVAANHHFVLSVHEKARPFSAGRYEVEILARVVGTAHPLKVAAFAIDLSRSHSAALAAHRGVMFERMPSGEYQGHAQNRPIS